MEIPNLPRLYGEGGKGSKPKPLDYPANLKNTQSVYLLFVVSEGEITSIDDIYLDDVSIREFVASWTFTYGEVNQNSIVHLNSTAITEGVDVPIPYEDASGVARPVAGAYEYIDVAVNFSQVVHINEFNDSIYAMVNFYFYVSDSYGGAETFVGRQDIYGKSDGIYQATFRVHRPATNNGNHEWGFRIVHGVAERHPLTPQATMNIPYITYYSTENISNYPHSALIAIRLEDSTQTNGRIPNISVRGSGIKLMLPSSTYYNPTTGLYSNGAGGWVAPTDPTRIPWNGTFNTIAGIPTYRFSNNLSWCIYNFLSDWLYFEVDGIRYPVGCDIPRNLLAHFTFEEFARYCDEVLHYQEYAGAPYSYERRYTLNRQFYERKDAKVARDDMLTLGNAELIEYGGLVSIVWDRRFTQAEIDQSLLFTNQNVLNGLFEYASADITDNNTQINVTIQEIDNRNRTRTVLVLVDELEDFLGLPRGHFVGLYGYTSSDFLMLGCASVASAVRKGRTLLWDSLMTDLEGDGIVQFRCLIEAVMLHKGSPIRIHDSNLFDVIETGKIVSYVATAVGISLVLDRAITLTGITTLIVYKADGTPIELMLEETSGTLTEVSATHSGLLSLIPNSLFVQKTERTAVYKVTNITKEEETYLIEAIKYDSRKYDFIEQVVTLPSTNNFKEISVGKVPMVTNVSVKDVTDLANLDNKQFILTWEHITKPDRAYSYQITWSNSSGESGQATVVNKSYNFSTSIAVKNTIYFFSIVAYNSLELPSKEVVYEFQELRYDGGSSYDTPLTSYDGYINF